MSRPLRIEYPDAWYHVMNRGRRAEEIFADSRDFQGFIALLQEACGLWDIRIAAYCLMPNHYHLLIQTPQANLSRTMRHINGVYTQRYNRRHGCDGQLFRGRYKSILVEADSYLLQLMRYIHNNPVKAGLADRPGGYAWSSHQAYLSAAAKWKWVYTDFLLSMLTPDKAARRKAYRQFMAEPDDEVDGLLERKKWPSFLGDAGFVDWVKRRFYADGWGEDEIPQARELAPDVDWIVHTVAGFYKVDEEQIYASRRGFSNEPRNVAIYLTRKLRRDTLTQIGSDFAINRCSSVSSIIGRLEKRVQADAGFKKRVDRVMEQIRAGNGQKSQE
ncbi:MAG: transposase [Desulfosudaceae bacterium]